MWEVVLVAVALWAQLDPVTSTTMGCTESPSFLLSSEEVADLEVSSAFEYVYIGKELVNNISAVESECRIAANVILWTPFMLSDMLKCDPYYAFGDNFILVTWTFRNFPDLTTNIIRFNETCFNRTCRYDTDYFLNTTARFTVELEKIIFAGQQEQGMFQLAIAFYNSDFSNFASSVTMPGYAYVQVNVTDVSVPGRVVVQLINCWINDNEDSEVIPKYDVIVNKSVVDPPINMEIRNFETDYARFSFRSFFFTKNNITQDQYVYAHCQVDLCDSVIEPNCTIRSRRKRRDVSIGEERAGRTRQTVSYGPFHVMQPSTNHEEQPCKTNNGGCSEICSVIGNDAVCACTGGKVLLEDRRTCEDVSRLYENKVHGNYHVTRIESGNTWLIIGAALIAFALLTASCAFFLSRRLGNSRRLEVKDSLKY